jgi:exonuclease III
MPATTLCTFNANNLFIRYHFGSTFPGDLSSKSEVEDAGFGYLPMNKNANYHIFSPKQRELAARALARGDQELPDIICLQEIESLAALRLFNEKYLNPSYPNALLIDSHDPRQIDVGVLSRHEIISVRSHVDETTAVSDDLFLFSRDCLEIEFRLPDKRHLTLFVNHLKSKFAKSPEERKRADDRRTLQAGRVAEIVGDRFKGAAFNNALFAVVGDFNDEPESGPLDALVKSAGLSNAITRIPQKQDRWTYWYRGANTVSQIDYFLVSPQLGEQIQSVTVERRGLSFQRYLQGGGTGPKQTHLITADAGPATEIGFQFARFAGVTPETYASDHCPVFVTFG